jgi:hypothetical protein
LGVDIGPLSQRRHNPAVQLRRTAQGHHSQRRTRPLTTENELPRWLDDQGGRSRERCLLTSSERVRFIKDVWWDLILPYIYTL